ncbi:MAG: hypothetical protein RQ723_11325, partial [Desulfuromonadales bacterium]|nr:hypothetical protein [Desulfuromonadales bacterium]
SLAGINEVLYFLAGESGWNGRHRKPADAGQPFFIISRTCRTKHANANLTKGWYISRKFHSERKNTTL